MWQRAFVLEYAREIAAITPPAAAPNETLYLPRGMSVISFGAECADWRVALRKAMLASMASYEYRVTEAADGTFPVELWSSQGDRSQLIYKTRGFQTRELAKAWIVPVKDRSGDPPSPRSRVIYLKPRSSTFNP